MRGQEEGSGRQQGLCESSDPFSIQSLGADKGWREGEDRRAGLC